MFYRKNVDFVLMVCNETDILWSSLTHQKLVVPCIHNKNVALICKLLDCVVSTRNHKQKRLYLVYTRNALQNE
jgi:hypothetical protein